jgi:hypothetical protein
MVGPPAPEDVSGETGEEAGEIAGSPAPAATDNPAPPAPTFKTEIDEEGTVIPRAIPVPEP